MLSILTRRWTTAIPALVVAGNLPRFVAEPLLTKTCLAVKNSPPFMCGFGSESEKRSTAGVGLTPPHLANGTSRPALRRCDSAP